jgi:membrane protein implicated in regulation of membrane protease activity
MNERKSRRLAALFAQAGTNSMDITTSRSAAPIDSTGGRPMEEWVIWLIFAIVLGVAEIFTLTAALGVLGAAAALTAAFATFLPLPFQLLVFAVAATAGVVLIRPIALQHMQRPQLERFGVDALVGKPACVLEEVTGVGGRVRIGGEEWTARAFDETVVIPAGTVVDVMEIKGTTALVYPRG